MFQKFGRYILLEKIATGGMAEIWLAKQTGVKGFEKLVIIKKILPHFNTNEKFTEMFINEAKIASKLAHPNIVQIYDLGNENNIFYIAMEYVPGYDLLTIIQKSIKAKRRLPLAYSIKILSQAANALYYANNLRDVNTQKLNIVHRDITPQNILVSYDGITKIVDFGIAKAASSESMTKTGVLKGKYPYMSPEQILGKKLDGRSDIFSLAIILYEITVGKRLFKSSSELIILKKITEEKIIPPIEIYSEYPEELNNIIMKALAKNRSERYKSAREFAHALDNFLVKSQKNIVASDISKWLKELFKEDIVSRMLNNKRLFDEAEIFLQRINTNKKETEQRNDKINQFEFDKTLTTDDLHLHFSRKDSSDNKENKTDIPKSNNEISKSNDKVKKRNNKYIKKVILFFILFLFLYLFIFTGMIYYNISNSKKYLEESLSKSVNTEFPGKTLELKIKEFCNKDGIYCNDDSIRVLEFKKILKLRIKYKIRKKLFAVIPFEFDYDENMKRNIIK